MIKKRTNFHFKSKLKKKAGQAYFAPWGDTFLLGEEIGNEYIEF